MIDAIAYPDGCKVAQFVSRRRSQKHDQLQLRAHPYESTVKQQSPVRGTRPIAGNGPYRLENVALQSQELGAESPSVPRSRVDSYSSRPRTAPQSAQFEPYGRSRSGFSSKAPSTSSTHAYGPSPVDPFYPPPTTQRVRSVSAFSSDSPRPHNPSAHVDLLDAVARINPSAQTSIQKTIALGKRDYGEDVADRNIAEFGGDELPHHDTYSYYTDDAAHSQDEPVQVDELQGRPDRGGRLDSRDGTTWGPVSRFESDGAGDDTTQLNERTKYSASEIYSRANQNPSNSRTAANSYARRESDNSDYSNANGMRGKGRSGRYSSASNDTGPSAIPAPWSNAITSANLHYMSGGLNHAVSTNESIREAANSSQPIRRTKESRGTQTTPPPPELIVIPPVVPVTSSNQQDAEDSNPDAYDPPPISTSRLSRRTILPTPPMSPTTGGSPTTSISLASLDKELTPPPPGIQASPNSKRHSRGGSASYSVFPPQDPGRNAKGTKGTAPPPAVTTSESSSPNIRPNDSKQDGLVLEGSSGPPRLEGVVDTSNTTDTEVIITQLPAVVHEHVTPKVHRIDEERITREIHNHDAFHRIQPIIDVEALPTKHYIPAPNGNGLIENPESELPRRHTKWAVQPVDDKLVTSASVPSGADMKTTAKHPEHFSGREPHVQDRQKSMTDDRITLEETQWRHPPQLENGGQESGQTVPLTINHYDDEETDYYDTASERYAASDSYAGSEQTFSTNAGGEEELLFRDSDLAFDGRLPGLEEVNPVVEGNLPASRPSTATTATPKADEIGEGEATKGLRQRREAALARKMG